MGRKWGRAVVIGAAVLVTAGGISGTASAASSRLGGARSDAARAVKATGTYDAELSGTSTELVITADKGNSSKEGTFQLTDLQDSGTWLEAGTTIVLLVTASPEQSRVDRLLIGTVTATDISGTYTSGIAPASWSATRAAAAHTNARLHPAAPPAAARANGSYLFTLAGGATGSLVLDHEQFTAKDGTATVSIGGGGSGPWIADGKRFAMAMIAGSDAGTLYVGSLEPDGISEGIKPGAYAVLGTGVGRWTAVRDKTCGSTYTVDSVVGNDANRGSCTAPFKTMTKALAVVTSGQTLAVEAGTYQPKKHDPTFSVPSGVTLIGSTGSHGLSPARQVVGGMNLDAAGASVRGLWIEGAVHVGGANVSLIDNTLMSSYLHSCIEITSSVNVVVSGDHVSSCYPAGVQLDTNAAARFTNDSFTGSAIGVYSGVQANANLGTTKFSGRNTLSCNSLGDLEVSSSTQAVGDAWDHVPPTQAIAPPTNSVDISTYNDATVNSASATIAASPCE
ncbi:MAG TPA: DUF1565 domain-containing protein [Acidimicrobiia bacterium]|nr:DUF1565 domain-containing protein [Acidimicrobiia bacterium]